LAILRARIIDAEPELLKVMWKRSTWWHVWRCNSKYSILHAPSISRSWMPSHFRH